MTNKYYNHNDPFTPGTTVRSNAANSKFDGITSAFELVESDINRAITLPAGEEVEITETPTGRANKVIGFDADGNIQLQAGVGVNRGNYTTATSYLVRDIFKDAAGVLGLNNWYMVQTEFVSTNLTADAGNIIKLIDVVDVENAKNTAESAAATATTQAGIATTGANSAANSASTATNQANSAANSASTATTQAGIATTQAGIATNKANNAATSASQAAASAASVTPNGLLTQLKSVDGASSGLDADLLDGQHGEFYRNASNLNAGTVSAERLPNATETTTGVVEKATTAEADAGTPDKYLDSLQINQRLFRKNYIINGNFDIWQRGELFSNITTAQYTADRAYIATLGGGTATISKNTQALPTDDEEVKAAYRHNRTVAGSTASTVYEQRIESVKTLAGKTCTVSFKARVASGTKSLSVDFVQDFGTGGSPSAAVNVSPQTLNLTATYQTFSFTFSIPSISGKTLGTNRDDKLRFRILETSSFSTFDVYLSSLQVEQGKIATNFEQRPIGEELALCQRYYWQQLTALGRMLLSGSANNFRYHKIYFPVPMRVAPTMVFTSTTGTPTSRAITELGSEAVVNVGSTSGLVDLSSATADAEL